MAIIELYTSPLCGYCHAAKRLLDGKGATFLEVDLSRSPERRSEMQTRANGRHTVPQIFIDAAARLLKSQGVLVIEHGEDQADAIAKLLSVDFFEVASHDDLVGRPRWSSAVRR